MKLKDFNTNKSHKLSQFTSLFLNFLIYKIKNLDYILSEVTFSFKIL